MSGVVIVSALSIGAPPESALAAVVAVVSLDSSDFELEEHPANARTVAKLAAIAEPRRRRRRGVVEVGWFIEASF
jgi:hypothetical protein